MAKTKIILHMKNKKRVITNDGEKILEHRYLKNNAQLKKIVDFEFEKLKIGQQIYDLRQEAVLTQRQLAEMIGTSHSVISRLESADYDGHSLKMLQRIAISLGKNLTLHIDNKIVSRKRKAG